MSPLDTIFGAIVVGFCALWLLAFVAVAGLAWWEDRKAKRRDAAKAAHPASYEASAYQSTAKDAARPRCAVPSCDAPVTVHKRVGYETWLFCLEHGLPYLGNEVA